MKLNRRIWTCLALLTFVVPVYAQDATPEATPAAVEQLVIDVPGIMPEGVEYDGVAERFLFGSLTQGTIRELTADGIVTPILEDHNLISSVGLQIDRKRSRLLVANGDLSVFSDPSASGIAGLASYDLDTGDPLFYVDLAAVASDGRNFANDVAVDSDGNAYVTNSFTPVIYKVDLEGNASVFLRDDRFAVSPLGLNGIDYSPDGYLLAAVMGDSKLYKIPLDDPATMTEVELSQPFGADGIVLARDGTLYAVANFTAEDGTMSQQVVAVTSGDGWATAQIDAGVNTDGGATTLALKDGVPYYIDAYTSDPDAQQYQIVRADLEAG